MSTLNCNVTAGFVWTLDENSEFQLTSDRLNLTAQPTVTVVLTNLVATADIVDDAVDQDKIAADVAGSGLAQDTDGSLMLGGGAADGLGALRCARATYSFAEHGGAVSAIGLGVTLPDNAIVVRSYFHQMLAFTSGGAATVEIGFAAATAVLVAQAAFDNAKYALNALSEGASTGAASAFYGPLSGAKEIKLTIATSPLTAGKLILYVEYVIAD